ncbi:MAG: polysaccharide deacetylase family protein [Bacteroidia bacterium]|nr:polysaccharide deacetylase family protein [Bacteroidia bacterium]MDW8346227.1 polysaccharide deacetylase family protein [Bacteroidia bacterium]
MYLHYSPYWLRKIFPKRIWECTCSPTKNSLYLTFDDGPVPEATPWVLDVLKDYHIKATFFCVGNNVKQHPRLLERIHEEGHLIGNHTYHHKNGFYTYTEEYIQDIMQTQEILNQILPYSTPYFRPPYGKITFTQAKTISKTHTIVMWSVLSGDFDTNISEQRVLEKTLHYTKSGAIIVFHDSIKAFPRLKYALPHYIENCLSLGYDFQKLRLPVCTDLSVANVP